MKKISLLILFAMAALVLITCKKDDKDNTDDNDNKIPVLTTNEITDITQLTAVSGGLVTFDGGLTILKRGVCWSTNDTPTISDDKTEDGAGAGSFTSQITKLTLKTTYYVRAYATNSLGTGYGMTMSFTTLEAILPFLTTSPVVDIAATSANSGGEITHDGFSDVSARGIVWNTTGNPTIDNYDGITNDGAGIGVFPSYISGLTPNTSYYVRAYATNSMGTAYGVEISFSTLIDCPLTIADIDGNVYNTVFIGNQCWMKENLKVGIMIDGNQEQQNNSIIEKYCYNDDPENCNVYGGLYQWNEMMQYNTTGGVQGICPDGWHLPTDAEWCILEQEVDPSITCSSIGWRGMDGGGKMKETGTAHWNSPNTGATNSSSFSALPGGYRYTNGTFDNIGYGGDWWSSSENAYTYAWSRYLGYSYAYVNRNTDNEMGYGCSVRCVKD